MFTFLMLLEHVQSLALDFKFDIIQIFSILVKLLHVNHKSHVSQPTITMYHTKVLKMLKFLLHMIHIQEHLLFNFSFNNYNLKLNDQLNNTLFVF
jgi:hypothetical protein